MMSQFVKDFHEPRSVRQTIVDPSRSAPIGTVIHACTHNPLFCKEKDHSKNEKGFRSFTVISIVKEGWCFAPYKKPKKGAASVRDPEARPLFEVMEVAERNGQRAISAVKLFSFRRDGKTDKGPRNEEQTAEIRVGMTIRFKVQGFMYEKKSGRDEQAAREDTFPPDLDVVPEFSLVEVTLLPGTTDSADKNFGMTISKIRMLPHSLHSYMTPIGLSLLPSSFDSAVDLARNLAENGQSIQAMIETQSVAFFSLVDSNAHLTPIGPTMFRLTARDTAVVDSVHEVDVREEDLLRMTNAGDNVGFAIFLCDMAAAAGALHVLVVRNPYFQKADPSFGEYRAIPLVNTERLLAFVDTAAIPGKDDNIRFDLDWSFGDLEDTFALVGTSPVLNVGMPPACTDFILHSDEVQSSKAYVITIGDAKTEELMKLYYSIPEGSGFKRAAACERIDYRNLKNLRAGV